MAVKEEEIKLKESQVKAEIAEELKSYIQQVDLEPKVPEELSSIGVTSPAQAATQVLEEGPAIMLPLSYKEVKKGLLAPVWQAIRWLAEWSMRITKQAARQGIKVMFKRE